MRTSLEARLCERYEPGPSCLERRDDDRALAQLETLGRAGGDLGCERADPHTNTIPEWNQRRNRRTHVIDSGVVRRVVRDRYLPG
jgi:hypothetical protein